MAAVKNLYGIDDKALEKWCSAFSSQINEMHEEGERKPDFCIAWCATCHLHKIVKTENSQDKFLGSKCKVNTDDDHINKVTIKITHGEPHN